MPGMPLLDWGVKGKVDQMDRKPQFMWRANPDILMRIQAEAERRGVSISYLIDRAVTQLLDRNETGDAE